MLGFYELDSYLVQFSRSVMSDSLRPNGLQHTRLPCPSLSPTVCLNSYPLSHWCRPTSHPLSSPSPPAFNLSQHQGLFQWVSSSHQVAKVLVFWPIPTPLHVSGQSIGWIYGKDNQKWIFFNRGLKQHAYESIDEGNEFWQPQKNILKDALQYLDEAWQKGSF